MIVSPPSSPQPSNGARPRPESSSEALPPPTTFAAALANRAQSATAGKPTTAMTDPVPAEGDAAQGLAAQVFNEHGFFGTGTAQGSAGEPSPVDEALSPGTPAIAQSPVEPGMSPTSNALRAAPLDRQPPPPAALLRSTFAPNLRLAASGAKPAVSGPPPTEPTIRPLDAARRTTSASSISRAAAVRPAPAQTSPIAVALRQGEGGLGVVVRLDGLKDAERARLNEEIVALLARHGLTAADITISAPASPQSGRQGDA